MASAGLGFQKQGSSNSANSFSTDQSQNQFNQDIWQGQKPALQQLYGQADSLFGQNNQQIQDATPGAQGFMNDVGQQGANAWGNQLNGGVYQGINSQDLADSLKTSMNTPTNTAGIYADMMGGQGNNYADAMKNIYTNDANRAAENMNATLDTRAAGSGMSGSSRHGVAQALGYRDINQNLQNNLAQTGYNTFDKDLTNKLGIAGMADSNTLARQQMLQQMLGEKQNTMNQGVAGTNDIQNLGMSQFAPLSLPWQGLQNYSAAVGAPTVLSAGQGSSSGASIGASQGKSSGIGAQANGSFGSKNSGK